jgi:uncharacterized membrane protein
VYAADSGLLAQAASNPFVVTYWILLAGGLCALAAMILRCPKLLSRFTWIVLAECAVISALFLYWANRITGEMFNFNGFFFYAIHLLALFLIAGTISTWQVNLRPNLGRWSRLVWAVPLLSILAVAGEFRSPDPGTPAVQKISDQLRAADQYELLFQHDDWQMAVGVANRLARRRQDFCVTGNWGFMFGYEYVCAPTAAPRKVVITQTAAYDLGSRPLKLPVTIDMEEVAARKDGFYAPEGDHCWSGRTASLAFGLDRDAAAAAYRVTLTGSVLPERPVEVSLNGRRVGVADGIWKSSVSFVAGGDVLRPGEINRMTFDTANSGPISGDARELGFSLMDVRIESAARE